MPTVTYTVFDGEIVEEDRGGTIRDYLPDPLGSTVALLDSSQAITDTWEYWPYGEVKSRTGTNVTPFQWVGTRGYYKTPTLTYIRARFYTSRAGSWLCADFLWPEELPYLYARSRVTTLSDRSGRQSPHQYEQLETTCKDILKGIVKKKSDTKNIEDLAKCIAKAGKDQNKIEQCIDDMVSTVSTLTEQDRELLDRYFGCIMWNNYNEAPPQSPFTEPMDPCCKEGPHHILADCCKAKSWACLSRCTRKTPGGLIAKLTAALAKCNAMCNRCHSECLAMPNVTWETKIESGGCDDY